MNATSEQQPKRSVLKLALACVAMFGFAIFVLPPMYYKLCEVLGINGRGLLGSQQAAAVEVDESRQVAVEFVANVYQGTPLEFHAPDPSKFKVHPGALTEVTYTARNLSDQVVWVQAVHSMLPGLAGKHINIMECFCFEKQMFEPGEERKLTFAFFISPELPPIHNTVSVSYTFFKLENSPEKPQ